MKRSIAPLLCLVALAFAVPAFATPPELPVEPIPADLVQPVVDGCDQGAVDPEFAEFGLVPEPTLMANVCGPCSMGECRGKAVGAGCALHAEEPVPGTCNVAGPNQCFDGSLICSCG